MTGNLLRQMGAALMAMADAEWWAIEDMPAASAKTGNGVFKSGRTFVQERAGDLALLFGEAIKRWRRSDALGAAISLSLGFLNATAVERLEADIERIQAKLRAMVASSGNGGSRI